MQTRGDCIDSQIALVLEEGPQAKHDVAGFRAGKVKASDDDVFDVWYYHGTAERELEDARVVLAALAACAAVGLLIFVVALAGCYLPASKPAGLDPSATLRA